MQRGVLQQARAAHSCSSGRGGGIPLGHAPHALPIGRPAAARQVALARHGSAAVPCRGFSRARTSSCSGLAAAALAPAAAPAGSPAHSAAAGSQHPPSSSCAAIASWGGAPPCHNSSSSGSGSVPRAARRSLRRAAVGGGALAPYPADDVVWVPFKPDFYSSQPVQILGSFNDWSEPFALHHDPTTGKVGGVLRLEAHHALEVSFKYQVGDRWFLSREDCSTADNQGCVNNSTAGRQAVRFSFPSVLLGGGGPAVAAGAEVHLVGSFTDWQVSIPLSLGPDGNFHADVALTPGHHTFRFLVDAAAGPSNKPPGSSFHTISSSQSTITTADNGRVTLPTFPNGLLGGGGGAAPLVPVGAGPGGALATTPPAERRARWTVVDWMPVESAPGGMRVNSVTVPPAPLFKVLYHSDAAEAHIHYRLRGSSSFARARMYHQPGASGLLVAQLAVPGATSSSVLELSITSSREASVHSIWEDEADAAGSGRGGSSNSSSSSNGNGWRLGSSSGSGGSNNGVVREPAGDAVHTARGAGLWRLRDHALQKDDAGQLAPLMLCTDLDGTLIEDAADANDWVRAADGSTADAAAYFASYVAPAGGVMVFNTGRSIGLVEGLLKKKAGIMPKPQAIITAVGTKVFLWDVATESWAPDPGYACLLNDGWDADKVAAVAAELRGRYNGAVGIVDDGSEHPHRLSLSVRADVADKVTRRWSEALSAAGVKHQIVSSIGGEWRYLDCIAAAAGKGRAMLYVASRYGILPRDVVAAGDSGNDLLMLGPVDGADHPAIVMSNSHPEVWDWLQSISSQERMNVYTPKAERAAGLVEGLRAIIGDRLRAKQAQQAASSGSAQLGRGSGSPPVRMLRS